MESAYRCLVHVFVQPQFLFEVLHSNFNVNIMFSYSKRQAELAAAMEEDARLEKEKAER